jgi:hypothetical protein
VRRGQPHHPHTPSPQHSIIPPFQRPLPTDATGRAWAG